MVVTSGSNFNKKDEDKGSVDAGTGRECQRLVGMWAISTKTVRRLVLLQATKGADNAAEDIRIRMMMVVGGVSRVVAEEAAAIVLQVGGGVWMEEESCAAHDHCEACEAGHLYAVLLQRKATLPSSGYTFPSPRSRSVRD